MLLSIILNFRTNSLIDSIDVVPWPIPKDLKAQPLVDIWDGDKELGNA